MDIEFHYYITAFIALRAGFSVQGAFILAYASQHVDDNTEILKINPGAPDAYGNYISQTSNILKAEKELMQIYPIFHFMPGTDEEIESDAAFRRDGKFHVLNTVPDNSNARAVFKAALKTRNLYRIGIATHMYADTFAHQNFVGYYESFNAMKGLLEKSIPDVGHADAQHDPDLPGLIWDDMRLIRKNAEISNKDRFLKAAGCLFEEFRIYQEPGCQRADLDKEKSELLAELDRAIGKCGDHEANEEEQKGRIARYKALLGDMFKEYDETEWLGEACAQRGLLPRLNPWARYEWKPNYHSSHWYLFQEAVKNHQWVAKETVLNRITEDLELPRFTN